MFFERRQYRVTVVDRAETLAKMLIGTTYDVNTAFQLDGLLFINDSTCEDGAQEYAVVIKRSDTEGIQVESVTFSWCKEYDALKVIQDCLSYVEDKSAAPICQKVPLHILEREVAKG
jgi:hypothetical protein